MKRISKLLVIFCLLLVLLPMLAVETGAAGFIPATEASPSPSGLEPVETGNYNAHTYSYYSATPIYSSLTAENGGYLRVEYSSGNDVIVEQYDESFVLQSQRMIPTELSSFGGIYICEDYNFLVFGQNNDAEDNSAEVIRVVRYSKDWERQAAASLYGANTTVPFRSGSLRFARSGDMLYIRTSHQMYTNVNDGLRHQANLTISIRISDMTITDEYSIVMNTGYGYVSHSFNQFLQVDGTDLLAVDHGDYYPRAVVLMKYAKPAGQETFSGRVTYANVLPIAENTGHYNYTGVTVGGFEVSDTHYLVAGTTCDQSGGIDQGSAQKNIFITATPKASLTADSTQTLYLTDYAEGDGVPLTPPHLVKLSGNRFCLLWTSGDQVYYCTLDAQGQKTSEILSAEGMLSDCPPIVVDGKVVWYTTFHSAPTFYTLDLTHSYTTEVTPPTCTEQGYTTYTCSHCDDSYQSDFVDALGHTYGEGTLTVEADVEQNSMTTYRCSTCGIYDYKYGHSTLGMYWIPGFRPAGADPLDYAIYNERIVYDPHTDAQELYRYDIPQDGATVVVCFSHKCGFSQDYMAALAQCGWLDNPYVNVMAVECAAENAADVLSFMETYTPDAGSLIEYRYRGLKVAQDYFNFLILEHYDFFIYPLVFVVTGSASVQNPVYGDESPASPDALYDVLCHVSESFAAYEAENEEPAPVCPHTIAVQTGTIEPTCIEGGYSGDIVCYDCGELLETGSATSALGHDWDEGVITKEPTCASEGEITYTCSRCDSQVTEAIPTLCGSMVQVDRQDTVVTRNYTVYDPLTGNAMPFSYETPEDGVTMLVFFSHLCGNCQYMMGRLDECEWVSNPYLNITAVECISEDAGLVMDFIGTYTPNSAPMIDFRYSTSTLAGRYNLLCNTETGFVWPLVVIITETEGTPTIRYFTDCGTNLNTIYNTLCCVSEEFAAYENPEAPEEPTEPETPEEPTGETVTVRVPGRADYTAAREVADMVNSYREAEGLAPLVLDEALTELAMQRAAETAVYWDHTRPSGEGCATIFSGYDLSELVAAGENIASGQADALAVMEAWMFSEGHRKNILGSQFGYIGVGCVTVNGHLYWVQLFTGDMPDPQEITKYGYENFTREVRTKPEHIKDGSCVSTHNINIDPDFLGIWSTKHTVTYKNNLSTIFTLVPTVSDVVDENGNVIVKVSNIDDGTGFVQLLPVAAGTGILTLPVYEGQANPQTITVTIHVHEYTDTVVPPTCQAQGYTEHVCACGEVNQSDYTEPVDHVWDAGTVTREPSPTLDGLRTYHCTFGCGETKTETIPWEEEACTHENTTVQNQTEAGCTEDGYTGDTVCGDCGEVLETGSTIPAPGHSWDEGTITQLPTPYEDGQMRYTCTVCEETRLETVTWSEGTCSHESTSLTGQQDAACTEAGYSGDTVCDYCGKIMESGSTIPASGHSWDDGEMTLSPTAGEPGEVTYTCTVCGGTKTESVPPLGTEGFRRVAGQNRFETAFAVADALKETLGVEKFDTIIVASGTSFADALSGSYLAAIRNAPILLSYTTNAINNQVKDYIRENLNPGGTVYILGGPKAVPESMDKGLDGFTVKRLAGPDRFGTNLAILEEAGYAGKAILVCTGVEYADSLSASAPGLPILLVWRSLTEDQKAFLETISGSLYIIGGESAVSDKLMNQVSAYGYTERLGGSNRFETSVLLARTFFPHATRAALAYAWAFPDGLCGGALAAAMDVPLILTMNCYEAAATAYTAENSITGGVVFGTGELISDESVAAVAGKAEPGHSYTQETVEPSCSSGGYTLHTCTKCGSTKKTDKTPALDHDYTETTVVPTFDEGGYTLYTCTACGYEKKTNVTEPLDPALKEVFDLVNEARAEAGLEPLVYYFEGQAAADLRAQEITTSFSHTRPNGESCFTVFDELGLERWPSGENIAIGYPSAASVMNGWMNSQGHRENILNPGAGAILIGKLGSAWVMLLAY